ncbi:MAG: hypothetical protein WD512_07560 [Candidatus Paceibacterota bacterium]
MAWINYEYLKEKKMSPEDFLILQTIKQNKSEDRCKEVEYLCDKADLFYLEEEGLVEYIKGKKDETKYQKIRLTKKGQSVLDDLGTAGVIEEDIQMYNWLGGIYKKQGKELGNKSKGKRMLAQFRAESGITKNHLAFLCKAFLNDEIAYKYSQRLEYLFFKAPGAFNTRFDLGESKLWRYYEERKEYFENKFKGIKNEQ